MTPAFTVHKLIRKGEAVAPGTVIPLPDDEFNDLKAMGAVRTPTENELALFDMIEASKTPKPKPKPAAKAKAAAKPKVEPKADDTVAAAGSDDDLLGN